MPRTSCMHAEEDRCSNRRGVDAWCSAAVFSFLFFLLFIIFNKKEAFGGSRLLLCSKSIFLMIYSSRCGVQFISWECSARPLSNTCRCFRTRDLVRPGPLVLSLQPLLCSEGLPLGRRVASVRARPYLCRDCAGPAVCPGVRVQLPDHDLASGGDGS